MCLSDHDAGASDEMEDDTMGGEEEVVVEGEGTRAADSLESAAGTEGAATAAALTVGDGVRLLVISCGLRGLCSRLLTCAAPTPHSVCAGVCAMGANWE